MEEEIKYKKMKKILLISSIVLVCLLIIFLLNLTFKDQLNRFKKAFDYVAIPALISLVGSYLINPLLDKLTEKIKNRRLAVVLAITIFLLILFIILFGIIVICVYQIYNIIVNFSDNFETIKQAIINILPDSEKIFEYIKEYLFDGDKLSIENINNIFNLVKTVFGILGQIAIYFILVPFYLYYILFDKDKIALSIANIVSEKNKDHIMNVYRITDDSTTRYFTGKLKSMVFVGCMFLLILPIFFIIINGGKNILDSILYGIAFSLVFMILDIIPYIGPFFGTVGIMLYTIVVALSNNMSLFFIILYPCIALVINFIAQGLESAVIVPKVISKEVNINPLIVLISILFFGSLMGVSGTILAIPIVSICKDIYNYVKDYKKQQKNIKIKKDEINQEDQ